MSRFFKRATLEQKYIKLCCYGAQGSGKTLTMMDIADSISKIEKGTFCVIQNEQTGSEFYTQKSNKRKLHPEPFVYDIAVTKSITEAMKAAEEAIQDKNIKVIIVDSLTKYRDNAKEVFGEKNAAGAIKMHKWNKINEVYNKFVNLLLDCDKHVLFTSRSGNLYESGKDDSMVKTGTQAKVGPDTAYEAQTVLKFESKPAKDGSTIIRAFGEKDRTSTIQDMWIDWPCFKNTIGLIYNQLANKQSKMEDRVNKDKEESAREEAEYFEKSERGLKYYGDQISHCKSLDDLNSISKSISDKSGNFHDEHMVELQKMIVSKRSELDADSKTVEKLKSPI